MLFNRIFFLVFTLTAILRASVTVACFSLENNTSDTLLDWISNSFMEAAYINFSNSDQIRIWQPVLMNKIDPIVLTTDDAKIIKHSEKWSWNCSIIGSYKRKNDGNIEFNIVLLSVDDGNLQKKNIKFITREDLILKKIDSVIVKILAKKKIEVDEKTLKKIRNFEKTNSTSYAVYCRGIGYEIAEETEKAVSAYVASSELDQNFLPPLIRLADIYSQSSTTEESEKYLARLVSPKNMKNDQVVATYAKYLINKESFKKSEKFIQSKYSILRMTSSGLTQIGNYYIRSGEFQRAISQLTKSIALGVSDLDSYFILAKAYSLSGNYERAIDIFSKLVSFRPNYVNYYTLLGETYRKAGKFMEAGAVLRKSVEMAPTNVSVLVNVANVYFDLGWYDKAQFLLEKAYKIAPYRDEISLNLGVVYWHKGLVDKAEKFFQKAIENPKISSDASNNYANLLLSTGKIKEALSLYRKALKNSGGGNTSIMFNMATCYESLGKTKNSLKILKEIVEIDPGDYETILKVAKEESKLKNYEEAENYYRMLRRLEPDSKDVMSYLIDILAKNGKYKEATSIVNEYLQTYPQDIEYTYKLINLYIAMGWNKVALSQCQSMLGNENFKNNSATYLLLGQAYYALFKTDENKEYDKAIYYLKLGVELPGNKMELYELIGKIYLRFKGYKEMAADAFIEALRCAKTETDQMRIRKFIQECRS